MKINMKLLGMSAAVFGSVACNEVQYDPKALGFTDKAEMEAAFAKGYHTKQKLVEMQPSTPKVAAATIESPTATPPTEPTPITPAVASLETAQQQTSALCVYQARISNADKKNSSGVGLATAKTQTVAAAIIRQDRANYHQFNVRDSEDQSDCLFGSRDKRAGIEAMIGGTLSNDDINMIVEGNPLIRVVVFENRMTVSASK